PERVSSERARALPGAPEEPAMPLADRFQLDIQGISDPIPVVRMSGHEGVSELFRFELTLAVEGSGLDFSSAVGKPALLTMKAEQDPGYVTGIVPRLLEGDAGKKLPTYEVTLVPKVWPLPHRSDCRIFQELTAPAIIQKVLEGAGLASGDDFRIALQ